MGILCTSSVVGVMDFEETTNHLFFKNFLLKTECVIYNNQNSKIKSLWKKVQIINFWDLSISSLKYMNKVIFDFQVLVSRIKIFIVQQILKNQLFSRFYISPKSIQFLKTFFNFVYLSVLGICWEFQIFSNNTYINRFIENPVKNTFYWFYLVCDLFQNIRSPK